MRRALSVAGFAVSLAIVGAVAVKGADDLDPARLDIWPLPFAFVLVTLWWVLLASGWGLLLNGYVAREEMSVWCRTQSLRYLPGGLWAPASRLYITRGSWVDRLATVGAENVTALCAAWSLGGIAFAASGRPEWLPLALVAFVPVLASRFLATRTRVAPDRTIPASLCYLAGYAAYAGAAILVQGAVSGFEDAAAVAGAALIAWGVGLVVVIAPGGVGVREAAYVGLLSTTFPDGDLAAAAVTLRVVTVFAELAVLAVLARPLPGTAAG